LAKRPFFCHFYADLAPYFSRFLAILAKIEALDATFSPRLLKYQDVVGALTAEGFPCRRDARFEADFWDRALR
jgi:hypothetical protein